MEAPEVAAWVLEAERPGDLRRALRRIRTSAEVRREVGLDAAACVELAGPSDRLAGRVERTLGRAPEIRLDCDVARFPLGRGWVAVVLEPPAEDLELALDDLGLAYREVRREHLPGAAAQVCSPLAAVADPSALDEALAERGLVVRAVYEVGGCSR